ncbi:MAG: hypothetical protein GF353_06150 [Candidatus Lokiarchaeota archaeon]|nr:hypothetical protein [Candidatus Lokiarchaeota archaeon]
MSADKTNERYQIVSFKAKSLKNNPIDSPVERKLAVYLPPDYFETERRYPVVYFIHGYNGNIENLSITPHWTDNKNFPVELIPPDVLKMFDLENIPSYSKFDKLITEEGWMPFILIQPDVSLYLPHCLGHKELSGAVKTKGSFYINSPFTGNFADYFIKDVIDYVDSNYRTISNKKNRALVGPSMGGYGALYLLFNYPHKFNSVASLSPANMTVEILDHKMVTPINKILYGKEEAVELGRAAIKDITDTFDIITSKNNSIFSSIKRDEKGNIVQLNEDSVKNWQKYDLVNVIKTCSKKNPDAFKDVNLLINCHRKDEYGFADETRRIHQTLNDLGIDHLFEIYKDYRTKLAPHMLGIAYKMIPAIEYSVQCFN